MAEANTGLTTRNIGTNTKLASAVSIAATAADKELLSFHVDKTYATFIESGKTLGNSFVTYLLLVCLSALLVFGSGVEDKAMVPFLQITVAKPYAAAMILTLSHIALYWFLSTAAYFSVVVNKLSSLLAQRYGSKKVLLWSLHHPSPFYTSLIILIAVFRSERVSEIAGWVILSGLLIALFLSPLVLTWSVVIALGWSGEWKTVALAGSFLFLMPSAFAAWATWRLSEEETAIFDERLS